MKKRSIVSVIVALMLVAITVLAVFAGSESTVAGANTKLAAYDTKTLLEDKVKVLDDVVAYVQDINVNEEGYAELIGAIDVKELEVAKLYYAELDTANTAVFGASLRRLSGFVKAHPFANTVDGAVEFMADYSAKLGEFEAMKAEAKAEAMLATRVNDWERNPKINLNFNDVEYAEDPRVNVGELTAQKNVVSNQVISFIGEEAGDDGNGYYTVKYEVANNHFRTSASTSGIRESFVFEMDITTFGVLPNAGQNDKLIWIEHGSATAADVTWDQVYCSIKGNGDIIASNNGATLLEKAIVAGEWLHLSIIVDMNTNAVRVLADYTEIGSFSIAEPTNGYTSAPQFINIGANPSVAGGQFSIDNVKLYQGYAVRDFDFFTSMTEEERFVFMVSQISSDKLDSVKAKKEYYDAASNLIALYYNAETAEYLTENASVIDAVDKLLAFDIAALKSELAAANQEILNEVIAKLTAKQRNEDSYSYRSFFVSEAERVLNLCGNDINKSTAEYTRCYAQITQSRNELAAEDDMIKFVKAVNQFYSASTSLEMDTYYDEAKAIMKKLNPALANTGSFPSFTEAYALYSKMDTEMTDKRLIDNAKKLLACIAYVSVYDTEELWSANYYELLDFVLIAVEIIEEGNFDIYYKDAGKAAEEFSTMAKYFTDRMRHEQILHINAEFARYEKSEKYFERFGILSSIKDYIVEKEVDTSADDVIEILNKIDAALAEMSNEKEEYRLLVEANTREFVEKCASLVGAIDYTEMKRICQEISSCFYAMDVNDASAQDAVNIYTARCNEIAAIEERANAFIDAVYVVRVSKTTEMLDYLIAASKLVDEVDLRAPGAEAAYNNYLAEFERYDTKSGAGEANAELTKVRELVVNLSNSRNVKGLITLAYDKICD